MPLPYDSTSSLVRSHQVSTMMLLRAKPPPRIFDPGGFPNTASSPSSQISSTKERTKLDEDWKRNDSVGFQVKTIAQSHEPALLRCSEPRQKDNPKLLNPGFLNPQPKSLVQNIVYGQLHPRFLGLRLKSEKISNQTFAIFLPPPYQSDMHRPR